MRRSHKRTHSRLHSSPADGAADGGDASGLGALHELALDKVLTTSEVAHPGGVATTEGGIASSAPCSEA